MILGNTKLRILVNAGHFDDPHTSHIDDTGAVKDHIVEQVECVKIRNELVPLLQSEGFEVLAVPDHLNLKESILWVNERAPKLNDGLAVDIHLNALRDERARGTEAFYGMSETSKKIAEALSRETAKELDIPDRGAKPDTQTAVGSLGWIRQTTCWASLIEVGFVTNKQDMDVIRGPQGYRKAARGIRNGILAVYGLEVPYAGILTPQETQEAVDTLNDAEERLREGLALVENARGMLQ